MDWNQVLIEGRDEADSTFRMATRGSRGTREGAMNESQIQSLCGIIRETSLAAHRFFRHGHAEKIYENSLANRLRKRGFDVQQQHPSPVYDEDGTLLGDFFADLLVEKELILELKAVRQLVDEHTAQILGYLRASRANTECSSTSVRP